MELTEKEIKDMIAEATRVREYAFAHRSQHNIGASVLTDDGDIYGGCNIESVISGLGTCAERCAINHMISHGEYRIKAVCTVDSKLTPSCGACLQYTLLFSQMSEKEIWMVNADTHGNYEVEPLTALLPQGYRTQHNLKEIKEYYTKETEEQHG